MKFQPGDTVRHNRGGRYEIVGLANMESSLQPVYVYRRIATGALWVRPQSQMEDGRFELATKP